MPNLHLDPTYECKVRRARATPPEKKLPDGMRLLATSCRMMKGGIRDQFPDTDEERVHQILSERLALLKRNQHRVMTAEQAVRTLLARHGLCKMLCPR